MNKRYFLVLFVLISTSLIAQTKIFSSENIDSLETAYSRHQETSLSKAYCLDQIVRYHSNHKNFDKASDYVEDYGSLSSALQNKDIAMRYLYRNARLSFLKSGESELDTTAYKKAYNYFKRNDPKMSRDISFAMLDYLDGNDGFGASWLTNREQLKRWYVIAAGDQFEANNYKSAATLYYNASLNLSLSELERIENVCTRGIEALENIDGDKLTNRLYLRLAEAYLYNTSENEILAIEKKIISINDKWLTRDFYGAVSFYNKEHLTQKGIEKRNLEIQVKNDKIKKGIQKVKTAALAVILPQGSFFTEHYDSDGRRTKKSMVLTDNHIETSSMDFNGNTTKKKYLVHRSYQVDEITKLLSVSEVKGTQKLWNFIVLISEGGILSIHDSHTWENREQQQDSLLYELLQRRAGSSLSKQLKQGFEEYYPKDQYEHLRALPILGEDGVKDIRENFQRKFQQTNDPENRWYKEFILGSEYDDDANHDFLKRALKNVILDEGFQPFRSTPVFLSFESERFSDPVKGENFFWSLAIAVGLLITKPWFLNSLYFISFIGLMWAISLNIRRRRRNKNSDSEFRSGNAALEGSKGIAEKPELINDIVSKFFAVFGIFGLAILGCFLGFYGGWEIGQTLGYTGGSSIMSIFLAIVGVPIGGGIGLMLGVYLSIRK